MSEDIIAEAKQGFDLETRLRNRGLREGEITLYTDEALGQKLGEARDVVNQWGAFVRRVQTGVLGEIDRLDPDQDATRIAELEAERDEIIEELNRTSLTVKLRAVPPIIARDAKRRAKATLNIKGKIGEDQEEEFNDAFTAHVLSDLIVSIRDNETGAENGKQTYQDCVALHDLLPASEYRRLDAKVAEIQYSDAVSEAITRDPDFSPAGS